MINKLKKELNLKWKVVVVLVIIIPNIKVVYTKNMNKILKTGVSKYKEKNRNKDKKYKRWDHM